MKLLAKSDLERLARNRRNAAADPAYDPAPVVKLFTPDAGASCLLAWTEPGDPDLAFGLCDLGLGSPELGSVRLSEILEVRGQRGPPVERDRHCARTARSAPTPTRPGAPGAWWTGFRPVCPCHRQKKADVPGVEHPLQESAVAGWKLGA